MRPSFAQRLTAALLAGMFVLAGSADVYGLHRCPHHGHGPVPEAPAPAGFSQAEGSHERAGTGHAPHRDHEEPGPCTCVGTCHGSASVPVVATAPAADAEPGAATWMRTPASDEFLPSGPTPYLIPYPTGPPLRT